MALPDFLVDGYKDWKENKFKNKKKFFHKISLTKQKPKAMIISCCDSRILENEIFNAEAGDYFIHKNIANLILPFKKSKLNNNTNSAIEYAVKGLKVSHIFILGHSNCGGIKFAHDCFLKKTIDQNNKYKYLKDWVKPLKNIFIKFSKKRGEKNTLSNFERLSIEYSLNNLLEYPYIKKLVKTNKLQIHGLWYDIGKGNIKYFDKKSKSFNNIA